jgi:sialic acid synthase SpsE
MSKIKLNDNFEVGDYLSPYIVAEVNTSHFGNVEVAQEMIRCLKQIGCNCVKFQSWSENSLYASSYYKKNAIARKLVNKFSLHENEIFKLSEYARNIGISFASTPYSNAEVDLLVDRCNVPFVKIASMEITNHPFLEYIAKKNVPIILSTGMSDITEIERAVRVIENTGNTKLSILHCVSIYPSIPENLRLLNITGLRKKFPNYPIGYSDHSLGVEMSVAAVALGASIIEKHFTLDKNKIGMDNQMALEPQEMSTLVEYCLNVHKALGGEDRVLSKDEIAQRSKMRRSIVLNKSLKAGQKIKLDDLDFKRPGDAIQPDQIHLVINRILCKNIDADTILQFDDFERE